MTLEDVERDRLWEIGSVCMRTAAEAVRTALERYASTATFVVAALEQQPGRRLRAAHARAELPGILEMIERTRSEFARRASDRSLSPEAQASVGRDARACTASTSKYADLLVAEIVIDDEEMN